MKYLFALLLLAGCASPRGTFYNCNPNAENEGRIAAGQEPEFNCDKKGAFARLLNFF